LLSGFPRRTLYESPQDDANRNQRGTK
jgi:hypothetical protein